MQELVRVRAGGYEFNASRARAVKEELEILDEPTHDHNGVRPKTRVNGRRLKKRTSVEAEVKKSSAPRRRRTKKAAAATAPADDATNPPSKKE